ncbi:LeuD/DmdB family oxidoreductase small subunit [Candidatus Korarchaeum cryptofilum]|uniref:3-isopropylmalate dehydratase small subunit n=1 Tax=Korarchaeum cryptofilum (strain OPF8) TaxID=374847 RepID=B1L3C2_KORCO|nr:3-isopropylmalate dehydratase, small subunit [Candidatus Korarchaeum cryptofilum OPF8]
MIRGRAIKYPDNVDTDVIIPARYLKHGSDPEILRGHAMEDLDPLFHQKVRERRIIVAGRNFGCGSSREQAVLALKYSGIELIIAQSFARIFFRNSINLGLPVMEVPEASIIEDNEYLEADLEKGRVYLPERGIELIGTKIPEFMMSILRAGGIVPYLRGMRGCRG